MSQLTIADLNFCDNEIPNEREVKGGITVYSPTGSFSTDTSVSKSSRYSVGYYVNPNTGAYSYSINYSYAGAVAGAAAGSASDGYGRVYSYATAYTY